MKPTIRGIDHIVLRVTDMAAMTRFYCDAVGCHVEKEQPDLGLVQLRAGDALHLACAEAAGARHIASLDNLLSRHAQRLKIKPLKMG